MAFATRRELAELRDRVAALEEKLTVDHPMPSVENVLSLHEVFGEDLAVQLSRAGYSSVESVIAASDEELLAKQGIGPATVKKVRRLIDKE